MSLRPIDLMRERVRRAREDSDTALFHDLLYAGEFAVRLTTSAIISAVDDDRDRHRYRLLHGLVRADGIGEWSRALDDALSGPSSQHLVTEAKEDRRIFTERLGPGTWQYDAVRLLSEVQQTIEPNRLPIPSKVPLRSWFTSFAELRNKTRGHGAPTATLCSSASPKLEESIEILFENNPFFKRAWAYLHRNLSGKYRVINFGGDENIFSSLKTSSAFTQVPYQDGIYIYFDAPRRVDLIYSNSEVSDFFFPNGAFSGKRFELHSPITDDRLEGDASPFLTIAGELPASETHGIGKLDVVGEVWSNIPSPAGGYVNRPELEAEISSALKNDRHPIITLVGRGGIGKTSIALQILHRIASTERFEAIIWFSARDIDLLPEGPKTVRPQVLTEKDISSEFVTLMGRESELSRERAAVDIMSDSLQKSQMDRPILFVFDNFETIGNPVDVFNWLDSNIRLPNKILITTRFREFKADYPITISGMGDAEANALVSRTADMLGIRELLTSSYRAQLLEESDGHPYVIKIMLGEVADSRTLNRPRQVVARKDDVLDALFERTFANLSPLASRVFLTLSGWRSLVPQLALEAVVLRHQNEQLDTGGAVDELLRMSLVQREPASDGIEFLDVPLVAAIFGARKLAVSPLKLIIENDIRLLQDLGSSSVHTLKEGVQPRIRSLFAKISSRISEGKMKFEEIKALLEFIASSYPPGWLLLADIHEELHGSGENKGTADYVRRYIEQASDGPLARAAWRRLAELYQRSGDLIGACGAFVRAFDGGDTALAEISNVANWVNVSRSSIAGMDFTDRRAVFGSLAGLMERRIGEASATDLSRLAWLYLHAEDVDRAREVADMGLQKEPNNRHCQRLIERLSGQ